MLEIAPYGALNALSLARISFLIQAHRVVQTLVKRHYELRAGKIKADQALVILSATRSVLYNPPVVRHQNFSLSLETYLADICGLKVYSSLSLSFAL